MKMMTKQFSIEWIATAALGATLMGCSGTGVSEPEPTNLVTVMIDGSLTYRSRQSEAIDRSVTYLDQIAQTELRRWEAGNDKITVITLDAIPAVLWEGSLRQLKDMDQAAWTN